MTSRYYRRCTQQSPHNQIILYQSAKYAPPRREPLAWQLICEMETTGLSLPKQPSLPLWMPAIHPMTGE
jgi:hypothetical protein